MIHCRLEFWLLGGLQGFHWIYFRVEPPKFRYRNGQHPSPHNQAPWSPNQSHHLCQQCPVQQLECLFQNVCGNLLVFLLFQFHWLYLCHKQACKQVHTIISYAIHFCRNLTLRFYVQLLFHFVELPFQSSLSFYQLSFGMTFLAILFPFFQFFIAFLPFFFAMLFIQITLPMSPFKNYQIH